MDTAIVIGGGPAGLVAASVLAEAGADTTVLEAKARLGGRAASDRREGFDLNQGPHALYAGGPAMRELAALGIDLRRWNPASLPRSVLLRGGRPRRAVGGARTVAAIGGLLRRAFARPEGLQRVSAAEWLDGELRDPAARELAAALMRVTTFVADHDRLSADVAAQQLRLGAGHGVRYLRGGWQSLVDALAAQAERRGATLLAGSAVRSLERRGAGWTVGTDAGEREAGVVVVAAGSPAAAAKLVGDLVPAPGPPATLSSLDLGLRHVPRPRRTFALGIDEPTYVSRHSPPEHRDGVLLTVASYGGQSLEALERAADVVQPGWRDELVLYRHLPRMVPVSAIATPETGGLPGRPGTAVSDAPGLFLAGDWVGPEGWLVDAALASGAAAARAALACGRGAPTAVPQRVRA